MLTLAQIRSCSTGKERDARTGFANRNDYFGARYSQSSMGQFLSPDPDRVAFSNVSDPQSRNLYSYIRNNQLNSVELCLAKTPSRQKLQLIQSVKSAIRGCPSTDFGSVCCQTSVRPKTAFVSNLMKARDA
jgi:RHS repeat-associated protein